MNNPYLNAGVASAYIGTVVLSITHAPRFEGMDNGMVLAPVIMLSVLVFSVALMGFLFFYRPALLLLDGKREVAAGFFLRTLGTFALITGILVTFLLTVGA